MTFFQLVGQVLLSHKVQLHDCPYLCRYSMPAEKLKLIPRLGYLDVLGLRDLRRATTEVSRCWRGKINKELLNQ